MGGWRTEGIFEEDCVIAKGGDQGEIGSGGRPLPKAWGPWSTRDRDHHRRCMQFSGGVTTVTIVTGSVRMGRANSPWSWENNSPTKVHW